MRIWPAKTPVLLRFKWLWCVLLLVKPRNSGRTMSEFKTAKNKWLNSDNSEWHMSDNLNVLYLCGKQVAWSWSAIPLEVGAFVYWRAAMRSVTKWAKFDKKQIRIRFSSWNFTLPLALIEANLWLNLPLARGRWGKLYRSMLNKRYIFIVQSALASLIAKKEVFFCDVKIGYGKSDMVSKFDSNRHSNNCNSHLGLSLLWSFALGVAIDHRSL